MPAPEIVVVAGGDIPGIHDLVSRLRVVGPGSVFVLDEPRSAEDLPAAVFDPVLERSADLLAPQLELRAAPGPTPDPWVAPTYRVAYPAPGRSNWRKRTRRANSHGQRWP